MAGSRIQIIGLVGAGAISSAAICSVFLLSSISELWTNSDDGLVSETKLNHAEASEPANSPPPPAPVAVPVEPVVRPRPSHVATVMPLPAGDGSAGGFLVELLSDDDPAVRSAAVWWLTTSEDSGGLEKEIVACLQAEKDPVIRMNLYRALQGQRGLDYRTVLEITMGESDLAAKITGYDLLAGILANSDAAADTKEKFNNLVVPELTTAAVTGDNGLHVRLTAVMALQRAQTEEAWMALDEIAANAADSRVSEAARAATVRAGRNTVLVERTDS